MGKKLRVTLTCTLTPEEHHWFLGVLNETGFEYSSELVREALLLHMQHIKSLVNITPKKKKKKVITKNENVIY